MMEVLGSQLVECDRGCNRVVKANQYLQHLHSQCQAFFEHSVHSPSRTTIRDLLEKDSANLTTPTEKEVTNHLIKRLMAENEDGQVLTVPMRGQVYTHNTIIILLTFEYHGLAYLSDAGESLPSQELQGQF